MITGIDSRIREPDTVGRVDIASLTVFCQTCSQFYICHQISSPHFAIVRFTGAFERMSGKPTKKTTVKKPAAKKEVSKKTVAGKQRRWKATLLGLFSVSLVVFGAWMIYLDAEVRRAFDGKKWALPAKVYARPLALYPGLLLSPQQLQAELQWSDYRQSRAADRPGTYQRTGNTWRIYRRGFPFWDGPEPSRVIEVTLASGRVEKVSDEQSAQALVRLEPQYIGGIFPVHNEDRELVRLEDVPPVLVAALIITEDKRFFEHWGISPTGIAMYFTMFLNRGRSPP